MIKNKTKANLIFSVIALALSVLAAVQVIFAWFVSNREVGSDGIGFSVIETSNESNISKITVNGKELSQSETYIIQPGEYYYFEIETELSGRDLFTVTISDIQYPEEIDPSLAGYEQLSRFSQLPPCVNALQFAFLDAPKQEGEHNGSLWEKDKENNIFKLSEDGAEWNITENGMSGKDTVYALLYFNPDEPTKGTIDGEEVTIYNSNGFFGQTFSLSFKSYN